MKAINLIPSDGGRSRRRISLGLQRPTYVLLGVLTVALALVTLYVTSSNKVAADQARLTTLRNQVAQVQSQAASLSRYAKFVALAQSRVQTVQGIAAARFDWSTALSNLARVVPAGTSLESLNATIAPGANAGGSGGSGSGSGLRGDLSGPAFELNGCSRTQPEVAALMSRLHTMPDVTRVSLGSTVTSTSGGSAPSTAASSSQGCPANAPTFSIVVFFGPVAGAGANGATSASASTTTGAGQ